VVRNGGQHSLVVAAEIETAPTGAVCFRYVSDERVVMAPHHATFCTFLRRLPKNRIPIPAGVLRLIHRRIGAADQLDATAAVFRVERDADARPTRSLRDPINTGRPSAIMMDSATRMRFSRDRTSR
jgi:hypothetical protein